MSDSSKKQRSSWERSSLLHEPLETICGVPGSAREIHLLKGANCDVDVVTCNFLAPERDLFCLLPASIKNARGIRGFMRRGRAACESGWKLVCGTHNFLQLYRRAYIDPSAALFNRQAAHPPRAHTRVVPGNRPPAKSAKSEVRWVCSTEDVAGGSREPLHRGERSPGAFPPKNTDGQTSHQPLTGSGLAPSPSVARVGEFGGRPRPFWPAVSTVSMVSAVRAGPVFSPSASSGIM